MICGFPIRNCEFLISEELVVFTTLGQQTKKNIIIKAILLGTCILQNGGGRQVRKKNILKCNCQDKPDLLNMKHHFRRS